MLTERSLRAMGSDAHVLVETGAPEAGGALRSTADGRTVFVDWPARPVVDAEELLDRAAGEIDRLERLWSRFRPDSDVSRLNAADGADVPVAAETIDIVTLAVEAWRRSGGRFDPTVLDAVVAAGYDRSFDQLQAAGLVPTEGDEVATAALDATGEVDGADGADGDADDDGAAAVGSRLEAGRIRIDAERGTLGLPPRTGLDLGGVGKGRAADLVVADLRRAGAAGACVNLGGDVRAWGRAPDPAGWVVAIADPFHPDDDLAVVALEDGAVVTSARTRRQWVRDGVAGHHLIDPSTGRPAVGGLVAVSVIGPHAAWAEIAAKAAFVAGRDEAPEVLARFSVAGLLVADDGTVARTGGFEAFEP